MTVTVEATLTVIERNGIHGAFNVGKLRTSIGNFGVRDTFLEELEPGEYRGEFVIAKIWPRQYSTDQIVITEVCVSVADHLIFDAEVGSEDNTDHQPDPADDKPAEPEFTKPAQSPSATVSEPSQASEPVGNQPKPAEEDLDDFFGVELAEAIRNRHPLKLDSTVDRLVLRKQRDRLREHLDYDFLPEDQTWYPLGHSALDSKIKF